MLSGVLVWVAQFHHFQSFGLYEDDYFFIAQAMGKPPAYLLQRLITAVTVLPQGRPFGFFLPDLFSWLGDKLGGLGGIYLLGFLIVSLNTWLCYRLLRTRLPLAPAAVGAAIFCLFPADTTKILLTHDFQLQPSLTFALLAGLAYANGRRPLAYLLSAGSLLSYENGFLALFALPLLFERWDRHLWRPLARHVASLLGVLLVVVGVRFVAGEGRATQSVGDLGDILPRVLGSFVIGPEHSLGAMLYGPLKAVPTWDTETVVLALISLLAIGLLLVLVARPARAPVRREVLEVGGAGAVMLVLAYSLAFTHYPPVAIIGRGTSVHLGATLGMAVLAAAVAWAALGLRPTLGSVLIAGYLALAVGYYVTIQRDFMRSWQLQRSFWQQVVACCSDVDDGTVLIYELQPSDETTFIFTNSWADPLVESELFAFPASWSNPPRLFSLTQWLDRVQPDGASLDWRVPAASWNEHWETLPQGDVILLRRRPSDGHLERITGTIDLGNGHRLQLKPPAAPIAWPPAQLSNPLLH